MEFAESDLALFILVVVQRTVVISMVINASINRNSSPGVLKHHLSRLSLVFLFLVLRSINISLPLSWSLRLVPSIGCGNI